MLSTQPQACPPTRFPRLTSTKSKHRVFTGGRLDQAKDRDDSNYADTALSNKSSRFLSGAIGAARGGSIAPHTLNGLFS